MISETTRNVILLVALAIALYSAFAAKAEAGVIFYPNGQYEDIPALSNTEALVISDNIRNQMSSKQEEPLIWPNEETNNE